MVGSLEVTPTDVGREQAPEHLSRAMMHHPGGDRQRDCWLSSYPIVTPQQRPTRGVERLKPSRPLRIQRGRAVPPERRAASC
jgi:hypothetical protein